MAQKKKKRPLECIHDEAEISESYKPIHAALKSKDGVHLHCRRLAHLLLINYLPSEVTRCGLLFVCVRDLFAQNLLHAVLDLFCNPEWLNEALTDALSQTPKASADLHEPCHASDIRQTSREDRPYSYMHSLSAIQEENSLDVLDVMEGSESPSGQKRTKTEAPSLVKVSPPPTVEESLVRNSHALLEYVQSSNPEKEVCSRSVATALGDLISTTAVPLLPDTVSFPSLMWKSPLDEDRGGMRPEVKPLLKKNPFKRTIVEGMTEADYKELHWRLKEDLCDGATTAPSDPFLKGPSEGEAKEMHRSKSLNSLPSSRSDDALGLGSCPQLSASSETVCRGWFSLDETGTGAAGPHRKAKGHLRKMKSFDRSDGIEEFLVTCNGGDGASSEQRGRPPPGEECLQVVSVSPPSTSSSSSTLAIEKCLALDISPMEEAPAGAPFAWDNPPDLSPIYEESENLASTIAKLR